ncbi:hypothetical protein [Mesorhizobium sp. CO1-1-8]|uniref:hypothetical protein n=1 Tax=Mesorhizobium sp. CO1-1-8 TaxID=2876631 RepID=UPI001CD115A2|nr:hypothetical protein [Mesorhizobium sp. CO1-1-8]MBZ9774340.1 hypothetical protein [Mesorhizobium sp. CO1-1-8]
MASCERTTADIETNLQQSVAPSGMIRIRGASKVDATKTAGNEHEDEIERAVLASQDQHRGRGHRRRRHGCRHPAKLGAMTSGEISTLHAALFFATVWIVSSLRIARLKALWRVGLRLTGLRGASGNLLPRGPKARAATGGSVGGAGASGVS